MSAHLDAIRQALHQRSIEYSILSNKASLLYSVGLPPTHPTEREAYLLLTPTQSVLYHSPFVQPPTQLPQLTAIPMSRTKPLSTLLQEIFLEADIIGIEAEDMTVAELNRVKSFFHSPIDTIPIDDVVKTCRMVKEPDEIQRIRKAVRITTKTLKWVEHFIYSPAAIGITELQLARRIESTFYEFGATGLAFPTIVAFDSHSASPHHMPGSRKLKPDSVVLVDLGASYHHYCGDMTRTWCLGAPTALFTKIERIVKEAYEAAGRRVSGSAGRRVGEVDKAARDVIEAAGYGQQFIHTTGHGIGLEAHEIPSVNSNNDEIIQSGMVITIEPGIYLPGKFGYRHENTVVIS